MRVLHINSGNMYGGVETFLATLVREAKAAPGMTSAFAVCFEGRHSEELAALGCTPHVLGQVRLSRPHTVIRARRALNSLLRREVYDVVVCHQPWNVVVFGSVVRRARLPVVMWLHMAGDGRHWVERLSRLNQPDLAICNSRFSVERAAEWLGRVPTEYVYYPVRHDDTGVSLSARSRLREELNTAPTDVVIVQVSRFEPWKGHRVLLSALKSLSDVPGWTCWIVGGAQRREEVRYAEELKGIAAMSGIADRVRFTGERRDIPAVLASADVFCQPNTAPEPFGLVFIEAQHAGLPIVTSGVGGVAEIVDSACGMLTRPGDAAAVSSALQRLIVDSDLRARIGLEARRRPERLCHAPRQLRQIQTVLAVAALRQRAATRPVEVDLR
ncbi:MAG TPA: glycosyltransferase [Vicinamibacterales bacterium]|nr:glycosyltransferase [Vicinamibacterales bacterium]